MTERKEICVGFWKQSIPNNQAPKMDQDFPDTAVDIITHCYQTLGGVFKEKVLISESIMCYRQQFFQNTEYAFPTDKAYSDLLMMSINSSEESF